MMKRFLILLLALTMLVSCLSMVACNSGELDDETPDDGVGDTTQPPNNDNEGGDGNTEDDGKEEEDAAALQAAADPVIAMIKALEGFPEITAENFEQLQQAYDEADDAYKALEKKVRNLVKEQTNNRAALTQLKDALRDYEIKLQVEKLVAEYREKLATLPTNKIAKATIVIDGQYDKDALDRCTPLTLTMADCLEWKQEEEDGLRESDGAGLARGEEVAAKGDTTEVNFYVLYDDEYLYIVEWRWDANWSFTASDHTQSYTGDGSMLWFVNTGEAEEWLSGGSMSSDPAFGLMWNAGIGGAKPGENAPNIAFFPDDTQTSPVEKTASGAWNSAIEWDANQFSYILELAIPWTDLADCFTKEDLEAGKISATFCTVDVVNPEYPGGTEGLWDNAYQMQYPGVNNWHLCRPLVVAQ